MRTINMIFWFAMGILPLQLSAVEVQGLYEAEIAVQNSGSVTRKSAIRNALSEVFIKLTGQSNTIENPTIKESLSKASNLVQSYRYQESPDPKKPSRSIQTLWVKFDQRAVNSILNQAELPIWSSERPLVLIWLAINNGNKRTIISENHQSQIDQLIQSYAAKRGLPIIFPILDLEEQSLIQFSDVWGGFKDIIEPASERYQADTMLIGQIKHASRRIARANWSLQAGEATWSENPIPFETLLAAGINQTADRLSSLYTVQTSSNQSYEVHLEISGIQSVNQIEEIENYFKGLSLIKSSFLSKLTPQSSTFELTLAGGNVQQLQSLFSLNDLFDPAPIPVEAEQAAPNSDRLYFQVRP